MQLDLPRVRQCENSKPVEKHLLLKHRSKKHQFYTVVLTSKNPTVWTFLCFPLSKTVSHSPTANHHLSKSSNDSWILPFFSLENHQVFPTKGVAFKFNPYSNQKKTQPTSPRSASQSSLPNHPLSAPRRRIMDSKSTTLPKFHLPPASLGVWLLTVTVAVFKAPEKLCAAQPSICCIYIGAI